MTANRSSYVTDQFMDLDPPRFFDGCDYWYVSIAPEGQSYLHDDLSLYDTTSGIFMGMTIGNDYSDWGGAFETEIAAWIARHRYYEKHGFSDFLYEDWLNDNTPDPADIKSEPLFGD